MDIRDALDFRPDTEHGLLVAYGEFARQNGLLDGLMAVPVPAKMRIHKPQTKILELFVGILSGIEYLQDLDLGVRPLTKDLAVAPAWDQAGFAHYSGVSRTLDAADAHSVAAVQDALRAFSAPFLNQAIDAELRRGDPVVFDADLTGQAVSSTSRTYPDAAFGWMDDAVRLGYQLARISVETRRYGRLWLAGFHHPGDTVSGACLKELVDGAEQTTGIRPRRQPELVRQRREELAQRVARADALATRQGAEIRTIDARLERLAVHLALAAKRLGEATAPTLPASLLPPAMLPLLSLAEGSAARRRLETQRDGWQCQQRRAQAQALKAQSVRAAHQREAMALREEMAALGRWIARLDADNATNPDPPVCLLRVDAGFASGPNLTWLIEMGYQVSTKAPNDQTTQALRARVTPETRWTRVGANADLIDWDNYRLHDCPYPLRVALERFQTGPTVKYGTLLLYRDAGPVPTLPVWFASYNGRQTIEAGNKESKTVFRVQHLMSRASAGIALQASFTTFASNFVRFAAEWLGPRVESPRCCFWEMLGSAKGLTRIAANSPAYLQGNPTSRSIQFAHCSSLPEVVIHLGGFSARQLALEVGRPIRIASP
jgi:hypothetical protein